MRLLGPPDPETTGPYRLFAELGTGAMGRVLLAGAPDERWVALKQMRAHLVEEDGFRARFRRAVAAARAVSGTHTAAVLDADADAPRPWLVSEYVPGVSLREAVDVVGGLPEESVLRLAAGLASALTEIHRVGLVHRDLKPSNVMLAADGLRVTDFGVARATEREGGSDLTHTGWLVGAAGFMSPEQAEGRRISPRSDVFSLGVLLVAAYVGKGPFAGPSTPQTLYNVVHTEPDLGTLPEQLRGIVEPCLAKDPVRRPTPSQLLESLGRIAPSERPWSPPVHTLIARRHADLVQLVAESQESSGTQGPGRDGGAGGDRSAGTTAAADAGPRPTPAGAVASGEHRADRGTPTADGPGAGDGTAACGPVRDRARRAVRLGALVGLPVLLAGLVLWTQRPASHGSDGGPRPTTSSVRKPPSSHGGSGSRPTTPSAAKPPVTLFGHTGYITGVAFSPDGRTLATGSSDGTARLWNVADRRQLGRPLTVNSHTVNSVAFSPDGRTLATGGDDGTARLWDVAARRQLGRPLTIGSDSVFSVAFSPDGRTLATGGDDGDARLWDVADRRQLGRPLQRFPHITINSVAFSPDGRTLATGSSDGDTRLWDVAGHRQLGLPLGSFLDVRSVAFSPDGRTLATGNWDHTTRLWDVESHRQLAKLDDTSIVSGVAFSPDGRTVATANTYQLRLWDVAGHRQIGRIRSGAVANPDCVAFSPDGRTLATGSGDNDGAVQLWNVDSFR